jgi:adenosylcobyric acid synthase
VTPDGGEIGMAQAMQAFAAKIDPHTDMNPILLKPKGDCISQIVLFGRPYKDVPITDYYLETKSLLNQAVGAFNRLLAMYGQVIVEGAGGAAELNLYDRDIANIQLAQVLKIPMILVADIERGGVFAQVIGTLELLPDDVKPLVRGIIINKFRGNPQIFKQGIAMIEERTGIPVLGVVPYFDLLLPSEDSLSLCDKKASQNTVRVAVIRLPRISNFTDFELLERHAAVEYVPLHSPLDRYDCIIIPGTKNTVEDLQELKRAGGDKEIARARARGVPIIGICGGYQMLGKEIVDAGFESAKGTYQGIGLLDHVTRFISYDKHTRQVRRRANDIPPILSSMGEVDGYEIHTGVTEPGHEKEALAGDGRVSADGLVFGTYMHGLFQNPSAVNALLSYLYAQRKERFVPIAQREKDPYDELAAIFEAHVDMDAVCALLAG